MDKNTWEYLFGNAALCGNLGAPASNVFVAEPCYITTYDMNLNLPLYSFSLKSLLALNMLLQNPRADFQSTPNDFLL